MAQTGLHFTSNDYDRERYERTARIAEGIAELTIDTEFTPERPYLPDVGVASAKVACCVAAFDDGGRVALIRRADNGRWALPGGVAEVGSSPAENALRELREETGLEAALEGLVGVYDNRRFASVSPYHLYVCCFRGRVSGGAARPSSETTEVRFVDPERVPDDMSAVMRAMIADAAAGRSAVYQ